VATIGVVAGVDPAAASQPGEAAAIELLAGQRAHLLRVARRVSICADDAEDALARATEILLTRGGEVDRARLIAWMTVVTRREALAVRRTRERLLARSAHAPEWGPAEPLDLLAADTPDPAELTLRAERVAEGLAALAALKPAERTALWLQAEGYSYAEIADLRGWTYTKVNRCLAEGRAKLRAHRPRPKPGG
jgi:RNA polymerase sigma factor (sigma-70 family)